MPAQRDQERQPFYCPYPGTPRLPNTCVRKVVSDLNHIYSARRLQAEVRELVAPESGALLL